VHAALALAVLRIVPPRSVSPGPEAAALEVTIEHSALAPPVPVPLPELAVRDEPLRPPVRPVRASRPAAVASVTPAVAAASSAAPEVPSEGQGTRECEPGEGTFLVPIDPRSVAARALAADTPDAGAGPIDDGPAASLPGSRRSGRQADLEESLRGSVRGPALSQRPPPEIRPAADGGYDVEGIRLRAHVAPDGRITFQDGPPIEDVGPMATLGDRDTRTPGSIGMGFRFDLNDGLWDAVGQDPLRTERQYLLRETEELRNRLSTRARRVDEERAILALGEELRAVAADRSLSAARRREEVFALWDDCATDAIGVRARTLVEDFIRERFPAGTALAYTPTELTRLNRRRATGQPFDPYRTVPDAGPTDGGA
jgi:hypothetical protein